MVGYTNGGLTLRYAYEQHNDYFGLAQLGGTGPSASNASAKDAGHKLVAIYRFGNAKLVAAYDMLSYKTDETAAGVNEYERDSFYLLAEQAFNKHHVWITYGSADKGSCTLVGGSCSTNGLGSTQTALGYLYRFDKHTDVYAGYYKLSNDDSASYAVFPPIAGPGNTAPGADTTGFGIGMLYSF
jgi:predicted porin